MCKQHSNVFETIERICILRDPCKVVIKKGSVEINCVEFRDAILPKYGAWSRGIEFSPVIGIGSCRIMARNVLEFEKRLHV
jgi:hypothetical protein